MYIHTYTHVYIHINTYRATIDELRKQVGDTLINSNSEYDDIFLLRFVLTWEKRGGLVKAVDAVKQTIAYREAKRHLLDEVCKPGGKAPNEEKVCIHTDMHTCIHTYMMKFASQGGRPPMRKRYVYIQTCIHAYIHT